MGYKKLEMGGIPEESNSQVCIFWAKLLEKCHKSIFLYLNSMYMEAV